MPKNIKNHKAHVHYLTTGTLTPTPEFKKCKNEQIRIVFIFLNTIF
jgi:hypothetical protein